MRRIACWSLALLLAGVLATPGQAQDIKDRVEYDAYMLVFNEKDFTKKAALGEKFLVDYKETVARNQTYMMIILSYVQIPNWPKALETADKQAQMAPALPAGDKKQIPLIGFQAASLSKNTPKLTEYTDRLLAENPNDINALITKAQLLANSIPAQDPAKTAQMTQILEINKRALAQPRPTGVPDTQWTPIQVQLHRSSCLMLLNQKKYPEAIAACQEALKLNKKDGDSYYLIGLAMKPDLAIKIKAYTDAVNKLNDNRTADQITRDDLTALKDLADKIMTDTRDEVAKVFAKSVACGGPSAAQARDEMKKLNFTDDEINKLVSEANP